MEIQQLNEVVQLNASANPMGNEVQVVGVNDTSDDELSDMDQLPPEILTKILDYLDEQQLVKCRLVNSQWNEISCLLLPDKPKNTRFSKLIVCLQGAGPKGGLECETVVTKPLADFLDCFSPSEAEKSSGHRRPFPFSCFNIASQQIYKDVSQLCEFVSIFGPRMKTVIINIDKDGIATFEKLWRLLLHFAPNIRHLILHGGSYLKHVSLFDPVGQFIANSDPNVIALNAKDSFLKNLKVLGIVSNDFGQFNGFMKTLLDNTPNVSSIYSYENWDFHGLDNLEVWKQLGKAHLLKKLIIGYNSESTLSPAELMKNLKLESLNANFRLISRLEDAKRVVRIDYIYHALKSNQETLLRLEMNGVTAEMMELCLKSDLKSLPNVRQLQITMDDLINAPVVLKRFSQICPNATSLKFWVREWSFSEAAQILWTQFTGLKSLYIFINLTDDGNNDSWTLDSAISGYSAESIARIQSKLMDEGISLEEAIQNEKQDPSILDLKVLSRLQLELDMGERSHDAENVETQVQNSIFVKILPQHIRENPRSILYTYYD